MNKLTAKEQEMFGYMEIKIGVVDLLIELSKKNGYLTTETLVEVKTELLGYHDRELILEQIEFENE
jgi:hypothetical protein